MNKILLILGCLILAIPALAAKITEKEVITLLNDWAVAQNRGSFTKYAEMYSKKFVGIRKSGSTTKTFDYKTWLEDRKRMFSKKMLVTKEIREINITGATATVKFEQTWESDTYKDKGIKLINLIYENGKLKIVREEMLYSNIEKQKKQVIADDNKYESRFTSLKVKDCSKQMTQMNMYFMSAEYVYECPAVNGWRLFKVYEHEGRSWINIGHNNLVWTTINQVWNDSRYSFGGFPTIEETPRVEWRISKAGEVSALIFKVVAMDPESSIDNRSRLFVVSLKDKTPHFCGMTITIQDARDIADKATNCSELLLQEKMPR